MITFKCTLSFFPFGKNKIKYILSKVFGKPTLVRTTLYSQITIGHHQNINMDTSLRLTSGASDGRGPTAMSIGLLPSFITWLLPSLFLPIAPPVRFLSFFSNFRSSILYNIFVLLSLFDLLLSCIRKREPNLI